MSDLASIHEASWPGVEAITNQEEGEGKGYWGHARLLHYILCPVFFGGKAKRARLLKLGAQPGEGDMRRRRKCIRRIHAEGSGMKGRRESGPFQFWGTPWGAIEADWLLAMLVGIIREGRRVRPCASGTGNIKGLTMGRL
jgi:hypothetical protein